MAINSEKKFLKNSLFSSIIFSTSFGYVFLEKKSLPESSVKQIDHLPIIGGSLARFIH